MVVFRSDDDIGVGRSYRFAPLAGVLMRVCAEPRVCRLVEQRQVDFREVHDFDVETAVLARDRLKPLPDEMSLPRRTRGGNNDLSTWHVLLCYSAAGDDSRASMLNLFFSSAVLLSSSISSS